jgi:hypothetical protein
MSEIRKESPEIRKESSADAQKDNAQAAAQLDALLHAKKTDGVSRLPSLRLSTEDIETQVSQENEHIERKAESPEGSKSIDV